MYDQKSMAHGEDGMDDWPLFSDLSPTRHTILTSLLSTTSLYRNVIDFKNTLPPENISPQLIKQKLGEAKRRVQSLDC
jgi:hypothetical protein